MKKFIRTIQLLSNISIIVIALLFGFVVVKQYLLSSSGAGISLAPGGGDKTTLTPAALPQSPPTRIDAVGQPVPLENVNWKENKKTLVFYISATCHFCQESVPFYQRLLKENTGNEVKFLAVLPQEEDIAKAYLKSADLNITQIYKASFGSIGVTGTPTLLLVNQNGVVTEVWHGKLSPDKETEVISKVSS